MVAWGASIVFGYLLAAASLSLLAEAPSGRTALEKYHAQGVRELQLEQRRFLESVDKELPRLQEREIRRRLQQQIISQQQLHARQMREQSAFEQRLRVLPEEKGHRLSTQQIERFRLEQERQQFQFQMEQRRWIRGH